jgi:tRNA nucleotidyltransferase (CCA-adding enzyme)
MQTYLVGGAVRDGQLGIPVTDKDYVVVGSSITEMLEKGFRQVGSDFPVFLHPETQHEYALARTERKSGKGYKGFQVAFGPDVTLEEDLYRRDLSINAMAQDASGNIFDPFGGQEDLNNKIIRHVSPHFREDPLRVLRLARFAAKLKPYGFRVCAETQIFLSEMVKSGELADLTPERVWTETEKALATRHPVTYFLILKHCGALAQLFPELDTLFGLGQPRKWHPEIDVGVHVMQVLQAACDLTTDTVVRFAALTHDLGKSNTAKDILPSHRGHELRSVKLLRKFYSKYPVPNKYKVIANRVAEFHGYVHRINEMKPTTIIKFLDKLKAWQQTKELQQFLLACKADSRGRTGFSEAEFPQAVVLSEIVEKSQDIRLSDEERSKLQGPAIGAALNLKRASVVNEVREKYASVLAAAR